MQPELQQPGMPVNVGEVLAGKYRVERVLGAGGMGVVVAAVHLELEERVAIKFLFPHALRSHDAVARFYREARAAVRIKGEHVARTLDVGRLESGAPYLVMEYLQGADLAARVRERGPLPVPLAVEFTLHVCEALAEAHGIGIIHRDLKPANLFVTARPDGTESVKVLDFGISKVVTSAADAGPGAMTSTTTVMGSPLYLSPEQTVAARHADARSDIWALGATLYEILTGTPPFQADSLPDLYHQIRSTETPALRNLRPDAPAALQDVVYRCLCKLPQDRFQHVGELAVALAPLAPAHARLGAERVVRLLQRGPTTGPLSVVSPHLEPDAASAGGSTVGSWGHTQQPHRGGRLGLTLAALGGLGLLGAGAAWLVLQRTGGESEPMAPPPASSSASEVAPFEVKPDEEVRAAGSASAASTAGPAPQVAARTAPAGASRTDRPAPGATESRAAPPAPEKPPAATSDPGSLFTDRY